MTTRPTDSRYRTDWGVRLRFLNRIACLTMLLAFGIGALLMGTVINGADWTIGNLLDAMKGQNGGGAGVWGGRLLFLGGGFFIATLLIELFSGFFAGSGRRGTAGTLAIVQVVLAVVLLVGINAYSFVHYHKYDVTRGGEFTLPDTVASELEQLREPTSIIVLLQHKTFGTLSVKPDAYDYAAERKVVEKVKDLAEQFQDFGPQFRVVVLDVEEEGYEKKLKAETADNPALAEAIRTAPENSIFFTAKGKKVQRLSFNEFYQLDKAASKAIEDKDGNLTKPGNLVLLPQGITAFTQRVLAIEEKKPRIGIAVIHELLSTEGARNELTMRGLRQSLEANGFEVVDIVLKRWGRGGPPEPAAYTYAENKLDALEADVIALNEELTSGRSTLERLQRTQKLFESASLDELSRVFRQQLRGRPMTEALRQDNLRNIGIIVQSLQEQIVEFEEDLRKTEEERGKLLASESTVEGRRITDVREKMDRILDSCDLLIVPRLTLFNLLVDNDLIPNRLYKLDKNQVAAVRRFMTAGKPVLALFGPANEPSDLPPDDAGDSGPDGLETMLAQLGIVFGNQTILYNVESKAFAEKRSNPFGGGKTVDVPPLDFDTTSTGGQVNPIRESMRVLRRSVGQPLDLSLRHPRPVYFQPIRSIGNDFLAEFLITDASAWNESKPFPSAEYRPQFDPKTDDPARGTLDEERRGQFPVGIALATTVPAEWIEPKFAAIHIASLIGKATLPSGGPFPGGMLAEAMLPADVYTSADPNYRPVPLRVAAIGQGSLFNSPNASRPELPPAQEKLLLTTCNWLLGREERLPTAANGTWQYPRVELSDREWKLWRWLTFLGLPALCAYIGLVVLMFRKVR